MNENKRNRGITLIALIVTIIVLLILAGVTIASLTGDNGILSRAKDAVEKDDIANTLDQIQLELINIMSDPNRNGTYSVDDIATAAKTVTGNDVDTNTKTVLSKKRNEVDLSELYAIAGNGSNTNVTTISKDKSYVGYYAKIGDVYGVIYADLAVGTSGTGSGTWNNSVWGGYEVTELSDKSSLKDYYITEDYSGSSLLGTENKVLAEVEGSGTTDRFYVMALEDFEINENCIFDWYFSAELKLDDIYSIPSGVNDFGQGKANTIRMVNAWNNETYGTQNGGLQVSKSNNSVKVSKLGSLQINGSTVQTDVLTLYGNYEIKLASEEGWDSDYLDIWGAIQNNGKYQLVTEGGKWFVASRSEWSAFGDYLYTKKSVTTSNYIEYDLSNCYWSSSQESAWCAYSSFFFYGFIYTRNVSYPNRARLSGTF